MAITQAVCNSFKQEIFQGIHDLEDDTIKLAFFTTSATLNASTTAYSTTNESSGTGYTAGGETLANVTLAFDGNTLVVDADNITITGATFGAGGALLYNASKSNRAIGVFAFGTGINVYNGTLSIVWPTADSDNALLRIA